MKEIIVDFRRDSTQHPLLTINGAAVELLPRPVLKHQHHITGQKSPTATLLSAETDNSKSPASIIYPFYRGTCRNLFEQRAS